MEILRFLKLILLLVFIIDECYTQDKHTAFPLENDFKVTNKTELPKELHESSGLLFIDSLIISFNDSGNKPILYGLQTDSAEVKIKYTWVIGNVKNNDWEDIAQDSNFIYIGDFGNNFGKRKDLAIYKIKKEELFLSANNPVEAEIINFSFEDQADYTPSFYQHSFDCEAMICFGDSIFIFSKDWKNLKTTSYVLPKKPGTHIAKKRQSFNTKGLVTGADYNEDKKVLIFTGYLNFQPFIWIFKNFKDVNFFSGTNSRIDLTQYAGIQNEGVCFVRGNTILMSSEKKNSPAKLFWIEINNL